VIHGSAPYTKKGACTLADNTFFEIGNYSEPLQQQGLSFYQACQTLYLAPPRSLMYYKKHKGTWDITGFSLELHWIYLGVAMEVLKDPTLPVPC